MTIKAFEKEKTKLLQDSETLDAWLAYQSRFPHLSKYFRASEQYPHQIAVVNGKKTGSDTNLYKLFLEQCFNLLRTGGQCGIVIPSGVYTDLGTTGLRHLLFNENQMTGLFCFENRKKIFEGVDSRFKFVVLSFEKGGKTTEFPVAFMRHDVNELTNFPGRDVLRVKTDLIYRLSPDSHSVMEFKNAMDVSIAEKMLRFPLFSDEESKWALELYGEELHMTRSAKYFNSNSNDLPVYEGGMIWHFNHNYSNPRYWINEKSLREEFLEKRIKRIRMQGEVNGLKNDYETYRLAIRKIASNTNERTLITAIIPPFSFAGNSLTVNFPFHHNERYNNLRINELELIVLSSFFNSFVVDYFLRSKITTNLNSFYLYQLPIPHLTKKDSAFTPIVTRAAKLICTTPEFDDLAKEVGLKSHKNGITNPEQRAKLRAELDGMIAHLYGLTCDEFKHILKTFPLVKEEVKQATLEAYNHFEQ